MITKLQFKIELLVSHIKSKFLYILACVLLISGSLLFHNQLVDFYNTPKFHTQIIGMEGLYTIDNLPEEIQGKISYGLTINSENDKPVLSPLVKSYDIQNNNNDYVFVLNDNVYWQNGKKFTAYDVNYQIDGLTFTPQSDTTLKVSLEKPFSPLLSILGKPLLKRNLVGLGDYRIQSITYKEGYINTLKLEPLTKDKNALYYRFYSNDKDLINAYKIGNVDEIKISYLPQELAKWNKTKINQQIDTSNSYSAVFFNTKNIGSKQLRQALAYATPKTKDKGDRCLGPIAPTSWAYNSTVKDYNYNPTRAKELFEKNKIEKISLAVTDRRLLPEAEEIKNAWQSILGIETTVTVENQINPDNFEAVLSYGYIPHDPDQYLFWHSTQLKTNITKLDNSRIDKLLEEGRQTLDPQERKRIYQDFQRYLLEESPAIFLSYPTSFTFTRVK